MRFSSTSKALLYCRKAKGGRKRRLKSGLESAAAALLVTRFPKMLRSLRAVQFHCAVHDCHLLQLVLGRLVNTFSVDPINCLSPWAWLASPALGVDLTGRPNPVGFVRRGALYACLNLIHLSSPVRYPTRTGIPNAPAPDLHFALSITQPRVRAQRKERHAGTDVHAVPLLAPC